MNGLARSPPEEYVPVLSVVCHRCGQDFPSEVSLSENGIRGRLMEGVVYECPHCGVRDPYFTAEHRLTPGGVPPAEENPPPAGTRGLRPRTETLWRIVPVITVVLAIVALHLLTHFGALPLSH
jgi:DNA-directed RNA polymerase subunit RPC12/RpoP